MESPLQYKLEPVEPEIITLSSSDSTDESTSDSSYRPPSSTDVVSDQEDEYEIEDRLTGRKQIQKDDLVCCICQNPTGVQSFFGLLCCSNCQQFYSRAAKLEFKYQCSNGGGCDIKWKPGHKIKCSSCRLQKIIENPDFKLGDKSGVLADELSAFSRNMFRNFSRWFYKDFENFKPGSIRIKQPSEEVSPFELNPVRTNNQIEDLPDLIYLTSQLKSDEDSPPEIEEWVTPVLEIETSITLFTAHAVALDHCYHVSSSQRMSTDADQSETSRRLNFKLKTFRTIIDRRPMFKSEIKREVKPNISSLPPSNRRSPSPLIGPGEDCDDSDDNVIMEIDCDNL